MSSPQHDIIILGAGPAGAAAALCLANLGRNVTLLDKHTFPRDKICGDALSQDVINQLLKISPSLKDRFYKFPNKEKITGVRVFAPKGTQADLGFQIKANNDGFCVTREEFDNILIEEVKTQNLIDLREGVEVKTVERLEGGGFVLSSNEGELTCKLLIATDGINSMVAKKFAGYKLDRKHHCGALRIYYENVEFETRDKIELHFIEDVLPGYLWIFPMANNRANVGIGMLSEFISKKKVNIKSVLDNVISNHLEIAPRFKNAKPLETVKGMGIPLGSKRFQLSGKDFLLAGDAASLVDPLTGEGIGNAIRSGRFAAEYAEKAIKENNTSAAALKAYDKKIYDMVGDELRFSHFLQKLMRRPRLASWLINFYSRSKNYRNLMAYLFEKNNFFGEWAKPSFYWKALFGKRVKN